MIKVLLCLYFLMTGDYKEREKAKHGLNLMLDYKTAKELHYKYIDDPEMAITLKEIAYSKYCDETRDKYLSGYTYEKDQGKALQDYNFNYDFKER